MDIQRQIIREQIDAGIKSAFNSLNTLYPLLYEHKLPEDNIEDIINLVNSLRGLIMCLIDIEYFGNMDKYCDAIGDMAKIFNPMEYGDESNN